MRRHVRAILGVMLAAVTVAAFASGANATTSGNETLNVTLIARTVAGERTVLTSVVRARGVFNGVGRIVEVDNLPGDPDNVLRDDLVFGNGSLHLVSMIVGGSQSLDPRTCRLTATIQQTGEVVGGTGEFAAASGSFAGELSGSATLARNPDGSCSQDTSRIETTEITSTGSLSF
jgi:hypothetical protein